MLKVLEKLFCSLGLHKYRTECDTVINVWGDISRFESCEKCTMARSRLIDRDVYQAELDYLRLLKMLNDLKCRKFKVVRV